MSEYILIVEGEADRGFFELLCNKLELGVTVKVQPPKELGISHNTKEGAFKALAVSLRRALKPNEKGGVPSTKGVL